MQVASQYLREHILKSHMLTLIASMVILVMVVHGMHLAPFLL